ncbi:MAG: hypothetical protein ACAH95_00465 [Fimbriimonas sp.]
MNLLRSARYVRKSPKKNGVPTRVALILSALALLDIYATTFIALGRKPMLIAVFAASVIIGALMGRNSLYRTLSLGLGAVVIVCTSAGISLSFWMGNGVMSPETSQELKSYFALHCLAIIAGHVLAIVSNARVAWRPLQQFQR